MTAKQSAFFQGARTASPLLLGITPFGLVCGAVCVNLGMPEWSALAMSLIIFAGASQLVATQLMADHASIAVVIVTGLIINARMFMYSASLAPHWKGLHPAKKGLLAYMLTDQAYALSIARYTDEGDMSPSSKPLYYFGAAVTVWSCFVLSTVLGARFGAVIPPEWDLGFAIPITFIAVVVPAIKDKPVAMAALAAGTVALLAADLPHNLGLLAGAASGIAVGCLAERRISRD